MNYIQHKAGIAGLTKLLNLKPQERDYLPFVQETLFVNRNMLGEADKIIEAERNKWANSGVAYNVQDILYGLYTRYTLHLIGLRANQGFGEFALEARVETYADEIKIERLNFKKLSAYLSRKR